jgi:predicted transcriptional regulator
MTNKELKAEIRELNNEIDRLREAKEDLFKYRLELLSITLELTQYSRGENSTKEILLNLLSDYHRMKAAELDRKLDDIHYAQDKEEEDCADKLEDHDFQP